MKEMDFVLVNNEGSWEIDGNEIIAAGLVEVLKGWLVSYHEAEGHPLLTFTKQSDNSMVSYWVINGIDLSYLKKTLKIQEETGNSTSSWIAIWELTGTKSRACVVGQIMATLDRLAPLDVENL